MKITALFAQLSHNIASYLEDINTALDLTDVLRGQCFRDLDHDLYIPVVTAKYNGMVTYTSQILVLPYVFVDPYFTDEYVSGTKEQAIERMAAQGREVYEPYVLNTRDLPMETTLKGAIQHVRGLNDALSAEGKKPVAEKNATRRIHDYASSDDVPVKPPILLRLDLEPSSLILTGRVAPSVVTKEKTPLSGLRV